MYMCIYTHSYIRKPAEGGWTKGVGIILSRPFCGLGFGGVGMEDDCLVLKLQRRQGLLCSCGRID